MSDQVLEKYIKNYINSNPQRQISFIWQGGEPTLCGLDFFKKAVALEQKYANGKKIYNSLQTNGLLINQEWCDFFKEHDFLVGISIDGPQEIHDKRRKDHHGKGTFSQVINSINRLIALILHLLRYTDSTEESYVKGLMSKYKDFKPNIMCE